MKTRVGRNSSGDAVVRGTGSKYGRPPFTAEHWWMYYWPYVAAPKGSGVWAMRWG